LRSQSLKILQSNNLANPVAMNVIRTTSENPDYQKLVVLLDATLKILDGDDHDFYAQFNKSDAIKNVIVFYENDQPVGCGAFKFYENKTVEIKRMYVLPEQRGKGIASQILNELEKWARELGYTDCILETGNKQIEAIALYQKIGYHIIPNYGQYQGVENSVCMQKKI
jgi:putative acetyltransferase